MKPINIFEKVAFDYNYKFNPDAIGRARANILVWKFFQWTFNRQLVSKCHKPRPQIFSFNFYFSVGLSIWVIFINYAIVKMSPKIFENWFFKNGILGFWSKALFVPILKYSPNDKSVYYQNIISTKIVNTNFREKKTKIFIDILY